MLVSATELGPGREAEERQEMTATLIHKVRTWTTLQIWCTLFVCTIAVVVLCVRYLDRPVCLFADSIFGQLTWIGDFKRTPNFFDPLALLLFALFLLRRLVRRPIGKLDVACILGDASLLLTRYVSDKLKYVFARTYPKYGSPSLIHDRAYSFNFFRPGHDYLSFPSGHAAAVCAILSILWIFYPRFRGLYALTAIGFSAVLVATNYHFLSDVIAGGFLGVSSGLLTVFIWRRLSPGSALRPSPFESARTNQEADVLQQAKAHTADETSTLDFRRSKTKEPRPINSTLVQADLNKPELSDD
jgi:membrane-associated phospholipid phosphatase